MKKRTTEEWVNIFKEIHGDKYIYTETDCDNKDEKGRVKIICPEHGEFWMRPSHHKNGHGCKKCGNCSTKEDFLLYQPKFEKRVKEIYGNFYDVSNAIYHGYNENVEIICPKHGIQYRTPAQIYYGCICKECSREKNVERMLSNTEEYVKKATKIHNGLYTYYKCKYIDAHHDIVATCKIHGDFTINANSHLNGRGCQKCSSQRFRFMSNEEREECFREIHGNKYRYDWKTYSKNHSNMIMYCSKHGEFPQTPSKHLCGEGCPKCKRSRMEDEIELLLINNQIEFITQYKCSWLGLQSLDFYLPKQNIGIECQGGQHFFPVEHYGGKRGFDRRNVLDTNKKIRCEEHGIKILYYSNLGIDYPYQVFEDKEELLKEIRKGENV